MGTAVTCQAVVFAATFSLVHHPAMHKNLEDVRKAIKKLGEEFHMARRKARLTLAEVSLETGVSVSTISRFELGNYSSLKAETYLVLQAFGTSLIR